MTQFIKTNINVYQVVSKDGKSTEKMIKEQGYLYKQTLNIRKQDTYRWTLSHQISGLMIMDFATLDIAKKAAILISSLLDWTETNTEKIKENMKEHENILTQIRISNEIGLEEIRLELLEIADNPESIIELMTN